MTKSVAVALERPDTPELLSATSLDPYGQLVKLLVPDALAIVFFDRMGVALWSSDGIDDPDLAPPLACVHAVDPVGIDDATDGTVEPLPGEQTGYALVLRSASRTRLGSLWLVCRNPAESPHSLEEIHAMLRPVLQCLERELVAQDSIGGLQRSLVTRDRDFELLLGAAHDEATEADTPADFERLIQACVDHLGCAVGALFVPDKNIAICCAGQATAAAEASQVLGRTHRHLIGWAQLHRQTMTVNHLLRQGPIADVPYKILSCPVMHGGQTVLGVLALFKPPRAPDFDLRQVRIVEMLGRRVGHILLNAYDPSTGLLSRPAFERRAHSLLTPDALRGNTSVIYVDLDRVHLVNENFGMHVGDEIIVRAAEAIRRKLGPQMLGARISGDRFALLVPDAHSERAQAIAEDLREALTQIGFIKDRQAVEVTASFGVAAVIDGHHPLSHALASAEIACKAAKDRGRNRVEVYSQGDQSIVRRYTDISLGGTVRAALLDQRFRLEAQPVVPLNGGSAKPKFELLLRMSDDAGNSVPPDKFLSAAERYQLAPAIDRWVVQRVIEMIRPHAVPLQKLQACFAVNISGQSLGDAAFALFMEGALRECGLPLGLLSFEVTETAAVANIVRAEALIRRLREFGCAVALDDFGRGLSSLTYLRTLPVTHLKIDGSFVRDVLEDERSQAMLSAIVQLAKAMKLETVAECVESEAIRQAIRSLGVGFGQGFSIGRPVPFEKVLAALVAANMTRQALSVTATR
ncbi:MAG: EAL domain-containing protein [Gammaproteobacteria bacterium]|nr:EAL domain-containing protein [Gammaproteobacteria bacterium]